MSERSGIWIRLLALAAIGIFVAFEARGHSVERAVNDALNAPGSPDMSHVVAEYDELEDWEIEEQNDRLRAERREETNWMLKRLSPGGRTMTRMHNEFVEVAGPGQKLAPPPGVDAPMGVSR